MSWQDKSGTDETKPFLEHLNDLRAVIIRSGLLLIAGIIILIPFTPSVLKLLMMPLRIINIDPGEFLVTLTVAGGFGVAVRIALWGGAVLSAPFIVLVISGFVFPALTAREKKSVSRAGIFAVVLFFVGVAVCYFTTLPFALRAMIGINDWLELRCEFVNIRDYVSFVLRLLLAFGLAFELPVVIMVLSSLGIVNSSQLRQKRPHVWVSLMALAMFLTPPDPVTQILLALPLALLYEVCIWSTAHSERRQSSGRGLSR